MNCNKCGAELDRNADFCSNCGARVSTPYVLEKRKNSNGAVIAIIVLAVAVIALVSVIIGYLIYPRSTQPDTDTAVTVTVSPTPVLSTPAPTLEQAVSAPVRRDLYSPHLSYQRMPNIHNTTLTDDSTFEVLKSIIEDFNRQCSDYMNEISDFVPSYLKRGSTAYNQQVEYKQKHPTLNQTYIDIDVINSRQGDGYYYVWVKEVLEVNEHGVSKTTTDHWVYKIERENGMWYICDYTRDPAF